MPSRLQVLGRLLTSDPPSDRLHRGDTPTGDQKGLKPTGNRSAQQSAQAGNRLQPGMLGGGDERSGSFREKAGCPVVERACVGRGVLGRHTLGRR